MEKGGGAHPLIVQSNLKLNMLSNISSPGSREFLGLVSNEGRVNSEVISPIFSKSSVL